MKLQMSLLLLFSMVVLSCYSQSTTRTTDTPKFHNKIDDISTAKQIKDLIVSIDADYAGFGINEVLKFSDKDCQRLSDSLKIKFYTKADFDHNGYTDLLVIGEWSDPAILCILDSGQNRFFITRLTKRSFQDCTFPVITTTENETYINYYGFKEQDWRAGNTPKVLQSEKLIYKYGDFIEYNGSVKDYHIKTIDYKTTMCYGKCPVFHLTINADRSANFEAMRYNDPDGKFKGTIDPDSYSNLTAVLNYIDFPNLKNDYKVGWTDDQSCMLTITYDNGKTKTISDYGLLGSFGLNRVYNMLFNLRKTQKWK